METPAIFGRGSSLLGMISTPPVPRQHPVPVLFLNAGILHRVGPHRLHVLLARRLAEHGVPSLRFDLGGIGDSNVPESETGSVLDATQRDIDDAISRAVDEWDAERVVLFGLCSGADNAFHAAVRDPRVAGVVLLDPNIPQTPLFYVLHYIRRIGNRRTWRLLLTGRHPVYARVARAVGLRAAAPEDESPFLAPSELPGRSTMDEQLAALLQRGCRVLCIFSGGLPEQYNHREQFVRTFPSVRGAPGFSFEYYSDADHTFSRPVHQERLIERVVAWVRSEAVPAGQAMAATRQGPLATEGAGQ